MLSADNILSSDVESGIASGYTSLLSERDLYEEASGGDPQPRKLQDDFHIRMFSLAKHLISLWWISDGHVGGDHMHVTYHPD